MSKIADAFKNGKAFIPFITCGDPDLETTRKCIHEMVKAGADLIELGIPFSDPVAEGPVIQEANIRALKHKITTDDVFNFVKSLREEGISVPMIFMTYANVVFSYGKERFMERCVECGVDGMLLPDVPYEEKDEFEEVALAHGIGFLSLISPTSRNRIEKIAKAANGFVYVVSSLGVTGTREKITTDLESIVKIVRENTDIPVAIGFGINTPEQATTMAKISDGSIVGSAIIKLVAKYGQDAAPYVGEYVKSMKDAVRLAD